MIDKNPNIQNIPYVIQGRDYIVQDIFNHKPNFGTYKFLLKEEIVKESIGVNLEKIESFFVNKSIENFY